MQEAGSSGWSFARRRILQMIICKWPDPLDDHMQEASSSGWSFARGRFLWMIICNNNDKDEDKDQDNNLDDWGVTTHQWQEGQKQEKKEKGKEKEEGKKFLQTGRDRPVKGSTRGPRGPRNAFSMNFFVICKQFSRNECYQIILKSNLQKMI